MVLFCFSLLENKLGVYIMRESQNASTKRVRESFLLLCCSNSGVLNCLMLRSVVIPLPCICTHTPPPSLHNCIDIICSVGGDNSEPLQQFRTKCLLLKMTENSVFVGEVARCSTIGMILAALLSVTKKVRLQRDLNA